MKSPADKVRLLEARRARENRGVGHGVDYTPWIKVQDFPSLGKQTRVWGRKIARNHHLMSNAEKAYYAVLEWCDDVVDIREQYPLPLSNTLEIAKHLGVDHPAKHGVLTRVTTDFLITRTGSEVARAVKLTSELTSERTLQKLEIERAYWSTQGIDWGLVTEREIPQAYVDNLLQILEAKPPLLTDEALKLVERAIIARCANEPLSTACLAIDVGTGLSAGTTLKAVWHYIATRQWIVDLHTPIDPSSPLRILSAQSLASQNEPKYAA